MKLAEARTTYIPLIEAELRSLLEARNAHAARHYEIMQYHMGWRDSGLQPANAPAGKRIRPMLCVLACAAAGGDPTSALPAAAGLELLHNFSLVHDDIEDKSAVRRHRPTAWSLWGVPLACNVGDGMFSLSHLTFFGLRDRGIPERAILAALQRFVEMSLVLTEGQYMDMSFEGRLDVSVDEYFAMIGAKTGALLGVAPEIGALIGGATCEDVDSYRAYGAALGRAFQLQDDILGIWGDEKETGKSAASDILSKKKTLPVVLALNHPQVGAPLRTIYAGPDLVPERVPEVLALLEQAGARQATQRAAEEATSRGKAALHAIKARGRATGAIDMLGEVLDTLVTRTS